MVLGIGEEVLIIARRLFEKDLRRHFVGEVQEGGSFDVLWGIEDREGFVAITFDFECTRADFSDTLLPVSVLENHTHIGG